MCRYNSAFTPELAVSGSVCKLNRAACDVANAGNGVFTAIFDASGKNRALERTVWFNGKADKKELLLKWRPVEFSTGFTKPVFEELTDLKYIDRIAYYIFCKVISDREREVIFSIGSDDGNKSWVNSTLCSAVNPVSRSLKADSEQFKLKLKKGENTVLVKVCQGQGNTGHAVRFLDPETGKPVTDIKISLK
ncbi:MAG: hypothetical protein IKB74_00045 [Lentisphaeria bacterium]|nr:hypothetical protein [Lentisphaeria bacterium]